MKACTAPPGDWRHPEDYPPPRGQMMFILTRYGVAVKGVWNDDDAAWMPLPEVREGMKERLRGEGRLR